MRLKLFCLDDDEIQNAIHRKYVELSKVSIDAKFECSGKKAVAYLESCKVECFPNVILVDLNMPVMNGWEFLNEINDILTNKQVKPSIYMLSSSVDESDKDKANSFVHLKAFLIKPLSVFDFQKITEHEYAVLER